MSFLKNCGFGCLYSFISIFLLTFVLTFFSYIDFVNSGWFIFFMIFNLVFSIFLGGFVVGKGSRCKGFLEGIKFGVIALLIISLINFMGFQSSFDMKFVMFSFIIIVSAMLGGMVGICFKKNNID